MKEELSTLKSKLNDFEHKYKQEKHENGRLTQLLGEREEISLSMRTEIKRKEI